MKFTYMGCLLVGILLMLCSASIVFARPSILRVIEEEAIPFTGFLLKEVFDQDYPGKIVKSNLQLDRGWYVIYQHESLNYYFGPILLRSTGEDYLEQLRGIVEEAVARRPDIRNYRLELSYEPSVSNTPVEADPESSSPSGLPQSSQSWGIFDFLRRLLGS